MNAWYRCSPTIRTGLELYRFDRARRHHCLTRVQSEDIVHEPSHALRFVGRRAHIRGVVKLTPSPPAKADGTDQGLLSGRRCRSLQSQDQHASAHSANTITGYSANDTAYQFFAGYRFIPYFALEAQYLQTSAPIANSSVVIPELPPTRSTAGRLRSWGPCRWAPITERPSGRWSCSVEWVSTGTSTTTISSRRSESVCPQAIPITT